MASMYRASDRNRRLRAFGKGQGHAPSWRSAFWRDRARLIHSPAFRRLQGKTQLFAGLESDFFRNRLTHSLEVSQIAKTITMKLNEGLAEEDRSLLIDPDLVEFAALAHDLGHPPFGHTGEKALDRLMMEHGGFEGNAQTLRILCRLEKKLDDHSQLYEDHATFYDVDGREVAVGLNLCARSIAAILKYDRPIPAVRRGEHQVAKGYYGSEANLVEEVRRDVIGNDGRPLKVVECQIMDLADDIAYSTYDLEDAFKADLLTPLDVLFPSTETLTAVANRVTRELSLESFTPEDVAFTLHQLFGGFATPEELKAENQELEKEELAEWCRDQVAESYLSSKLTASKGFFRSRFTSILVNGFIHAVQLKVDQDVPALSSVEMEGSVRQQVSVLKHLTYVLLISSSRLQRVEYRGKQVVGSIFEALKGDQGGKLLPPDFARRWLDAPSEKTKLRVCCDFIAGMTDRYALDFYARLRSDDFRSMFRLM